MLDLNTVTDSVLIRGNRNLIASAIDNLIENAISFSEEGGRVVVVLERTGDRAVITVSDQGPGADPTVLSQMFERNFTQRENSSASEHFGLGLWIVRRNILVLGGAVRAENIDPTGLRVTVELPLER